MAKYKKNFSSWALILMKIQNSDDIFISNMNDEMMNDDVLDHSLGRTSFISLQ